MELRGAVVAVTGASSGIGWETALAFAAEGSKVAACARRADRLAALERELAARGAEGLTRVADVTVDEQVQAFVEAVAARFGRLDVLVNNAGSGATGLVEDTPPEAWRQLLEVNLLGSVHACRAALPLMKAQGRGLIVNVSSLAGHRAVPGSGAYSATKAAQVSLTEGLRSELRGTGVLASSVHPVATATEFAEAAPRYSPGPAGGAVGPRQTAAHVARAIVRCARRPRPEVYPLPATRLYVWLNAFAPGLVDALVARAARRAGRI